MNIVVITARMDSERLPGKAVVSLGGVPNVVRLVERFGLCKAVDQVVVAIPEKDKGTALSQILDEHNIRYVVGPDEDVLMRVIQAANSVPSQDKIKLILRATVDCPFISPGLVDSAFNFLGIRPQYDTARLWGLGEDVPVYGSAEFPTTLDCLRRINDLCYRDDNLDRVVFAREHVTSDIDANRLDYRVAYARPARRGYVQTFYRPYRLELDTPQDLAMVNTVLSNLGTQPSLEQVVRYLDANPDVSVMNESIIEKTGPATYSAEQRARWKSQQAMHTYEWDLSRFGVPSIPASSRPLFCSKGADYLGYVVRSGTKHELHLEDGTVIVGKAELACECGAGRTWHQG